ncbi:hypothetical protein ABK040_004098 [Willaertia magna]
MLKALSKKQIDKNSFLFLNRVIIGRGVVKNKLYFNKFASSFVLISQQFNYHTLSFQSSNKHNVILSDKNNNQKQSLNFPITREYHFTSNQCQELLKQWEIIRQRLYSFIPTSNQGYIKELDRLIHSITKSNKIVKEQKENFQKNAERLLNSIKILSNYLKDENSNNKFICFLNLINIAYELNDLKVILYLIDVIHNELNLTVDYDTYENIVISYLQNSKLEECYKFIVDLEDRYKVPPHIRIYFPLYAKLKEILSHNTKDPTFIKSCYLLDALIKRMSRYPAMLQAMLSRDPFAVSSLNFEDNNKLREDEDYIQYLERILNVPFHQQWEPLENDEFDDLDEFIECDHEHCSHDDIGTHDSTVWNDKEREYFDREFTPVEK